jgi:hypothetical protein
MQLEETDEHAHLALSAKGRLLWCSRRAARLLDTGEGGAASALPDELVSAARRLGDLIGGQAPPSLPSRVPDTRRRARAAPGRSGRHREEHAHHPALRADVSHRSHIKTASH